MWDLSSSVSYSGSYSLTDSPGVDYQNNTDSWAKAPVRDLSSYSGTKLGFKLRGVSETNYDFLYVQTSTDNSNWSNQDILIGSTVYTCISGTFDEWVSAYVDLGAYDGESTVYIRFRFTSDVNTVYDGWYIDDVTITAASSSYSGTNTKYYQYMSGTSMAVPHVAGLAGLIWGNNSSLTMTEVNNIMLNTVDSKDSLADKTTTGGRINVYNALPPQAPGGLAATTASSSQIDLSWTDNSANESGFKIERKTGSGGTYTQIADVGAGIISHSSTGLTASTTYYYRVMAYNSGGNSSYSSEANATTSAAAAPAAPSGLSATAASSSQIDLSWTDNSSNETGFKIERKTGSGGTYAQIATVSADVTSYSSTGLTASTTYYYRIRAYNSNGNSSYSNEASATTSAASGGGGGGGGGCFITTVDP
jgi:hypothetical protein